MIDKAAVEVRLSKIDEMIELTMGCLSDLYYEGSQNDGELLSAVQELHDLMRLRATLIHVGAK